MTTIVNLPNNNPVAAGTTPVYTASLVDGAGTPLPGTSLLYMTLTIVDPVTGFIINDCDQEDILNAGRGTVDENGLITVQLEAGDTDMGDLPWITTLQRSLVFDWSYNGGSSIGRHQVNFSLRALAGS